MVPPEPSDAQKQQFYSSVQVRWEEVANLLAADRPPEWQGLKFEAVVESVQTETRFRVRCCFGDRVSNRQRSVPKNIVDKVADLFMAYLNFSPMMAWKKVVIEQIWHPGTKSWSFETRWDY